MSRPPRRGEIDLGTARGSSSGHAPPLDAITSGVVLHDTTGAVAYANPAAEQLLGISARRLSERAPMGGLWHAFDEDGEPVPESEHPALVVLRTRRPLRGRVVRFVRPDASALWLQIDAVPTTDGVVVTLVDVTARKDDERQMQLLARAERLSALGQMAAGIVHDLNHHLSLVAGFGDLALSRLEEADGETELTDSLSAIVRAAMDGGQTVRRLLDFARQRRTEEPPEEVDAGSLVRELAALTAPKWKETPTAGADPIKLHVEVEGDPRVIGWRPRLRDALMNLIFNAVDAMPRGGTILLAARRVCNRVELEVTDSGVGMAPEVKARAFEPFFTTKGERGTGLGLWQVSQTAGDHGGTVRVDSAQGIGTTFRISLPAAEALRGA